MRFVGREGIYIAFLTGWGAVGAEVGAQGAAAPLLPSGYAHTTTSFSIYST